MIKGIVTISYSWIAQETEIFRWEVVYFFSKSSSYIDKSLHAVIV